MMGVGWAERGQGRARKDILRSKAWRGDVREEECEVTAYKTDWEMT